MNIRNEIKAYIAASGWTLSDIVKEMNKARAPEDQTTPQNISNKLYLLIHETKTSASFYFIQ